MAGIHMITGEPHVRVNGGLETTRNKSREHAGSYVARHKLEIYQRKRTTKPLRTIS